MKNISKTILTSLVLSGLFFIPVLSSAQTSVRIVNDNNNTSDLHLYSDKSQAEIEAIEVMLVLEAQSSHQPLHQNDLNQFSRRFFTSVSNAINNDKSLAEVEVKEGLFYIETLSAVRRINVTDLIQASCKQSNLLSNILTANYGEEMNLLKNLR